MQIHHVGYRNRGFYRVAALGQLWDMTPKDAQRRFEILRFFNKHGLAATRDAFGVSRRTLYRWKAALKAQGGNPAALAAQYCAPRKRRVPKADPRLVSEIRRLRTLHPNLGKAKLHVLLEPWCAQHGMALPSVSTIGRIIARAPDKMRHAPSRIDSRGRAKPLRRHSKPRKPKQVKAQALEVLACSTRERIRDGMRRYIVSFIDPVSHFAFAVGLPSKHARYTARALEQGLSLLPQRPTTVLSDNGSEFEADFARLLKERGIQRWYTYPKTPRMNCQTRASIERSRSPSWMTTTICSLPTSPSSTASSPTGSSSTTLKRPHHTLGQRSPLSFLLQHQPECQRYWTHTALDIVNDSHV